jgi:hypothetical protein
MHSSVCCSARKSSIWWLITVLLWRRHYSSKPWLPRNASWCPERFPNNLLSGQLWASLHMKNFSDISLCRTTTRASACPDPAQISGHPRSFWADSGLIGLQCAQCPLYITHSSLLIFTSSFRRSAIRSDCFPLVGIPFMPGIGTILLQSIANLDIPITYCHCCNL